MADISPVKLVGTIPAASALAVSDVERVSRVQIPTDGDSRFELVSIAITNWVR